MPVEGAAARAATEGGHALPVVRAALTTMPAESAAEGAAARTATEEAFFMETGREFVALVVPLQERINTLGAPNGEPAEAARAELKRIKADLCLAKQLLLDMEMSTRSIVEPTRRELFARVQGHRETLAFLESHLACHLSGVPDAASAAMLELERNSALLMRVTMIHNTSGFISRAQRLLRKMPTTSGQALGEKAGAAAPAPPSPLSTRTCALV
jgi:hypothetical protein